MSKSIAEWHAEINATMRAEKDRSRQIDNRTVNEITPQGIWKNNKHRRPKILETKYLRENNSFIYITYTGRESRV